MAGLLKKRLPGTIQTPDRNPHMIAIEGLFITQMGAKKGLKLFGQAGVNAAQKELQQLHYMEVMKPKHSHNLTPEQKRVSLQYLMLLKKK